MTISFELPPNIEQQARATGADIDRKAKGGVSRRVLRVRLTVRRAMVLVMAAALGLWLTVPAIEILNDPARHALTHLWKRPDGSYLFSGHPVGFWARYRRQLLGLPWNCQFEMCKENARVCQEIDSERTPDVMIRAHPEVLARQ